MSNELYIVRGVRLPKNDEFIDWLEDQYDPDIPCKGNLGIIEGDEYTPYFFVGYVILSDGYIKSQELTLKTEKSDQEIQEYLISVGLGNYITEIKTYIFSYCD